LPDKNTIRKFDEICFFMWFVAGNNGFATDHNGSPAKRIGF
jgi:hypothetical protein